MRCSRHDGTRIARPDGSPDTIWLAPRLSPSVSISNSPSDGPAAAATSVTCVTPDAARLKASRACVIGMRLDRDHLPAGADLARQHQGVGADIGADIDEHAAGRDMRAQKFQLLEIVVGIEQRAALGGARLMIEPERGALILHIHRTRAQQIDQPRQHRTKRAALQPRAVRQSDDRGLRGVGREAAERRGDRIIGGADAGRRCRYRQGMLGSIAVTARHGEPRQIWRSTIFSFSSAIASEGLRPFGQALAQFMMV